MRRCSYKPGTEGILVIPRWVAEMKERRFSAAALLDTPHATPVIALGLFLSDAEERDAALDGHAVTRGLPQAVIEVGRPG